MKQQLNVFNLLGSSVSDDSVRKLYDLSIDDNINEVILARLREAEKTDIPTNSQKIDDYYSRLEAKLTKMLANRGI